MNRKSTKSLATLSSPARLSDDALATVSGAGSWLFASPITSVQANAAPVTQVAALNGGATVQAASVIQGNLASFSF